MHVPSICVPDAGQPVSIGFSRCSRCHSFSIQGEIPLQAPCKVCRGTSDIVCASCCNGFHSMTQCAWGNWVYKEYYSDANKLFPVCPDCFWEWALFLSTNPNRAFAIHEAEAITIMRSNAISASRMNDTLTNFLIQYIQHNHVSKTDLIHQQQHLSSGPRYGSEIIAAEQIKQIIMLGHIEINDDRCFWNRTPSAASTSRWLHNPPTIRFHRVTRKRPWGYIRIQRTMWR